MRRTRGVQSWNPTDLERGRKALFIGRRLDGWVEELPLSDSEALPNEIQSYIALDEDRLVHHTQVQDEKAFNRSRPNQNLPLHRFALVA